jgi:hypothetical protein
VALDSFKAYNQNIGVVLGLGAVTARLQRLLDEADAAPAIGALTADPDQLDAASLLLRFQAALAAELPLITQAQAALQAQLDRAATVLTAVQTNTSTLTTAVAAPATP